MSDKHNKTALTTTSLTAKTLRQQAEATLIQSQKKKTSSFEGASASEVAQMVHELQVHQVELEMQNDQLRAGQIEIEASRQRYFDLYDMSPLGYCTLDEAGIIIEINLTLANLLGIPRSQLLKKPFNHFIFQGDQDNYYLKTKQMMVNEEPLSLELRMNTPNYEPLWVNLSCILRKEAAGAMSLFIGVSNITEQRITQQQQQIAAIAFESLEGMFITDAKQVILQINHALTDMTGYTIEELAGQPRDILDSGRNPPAFFAKMSTSLKREGKWIGEIWNRRKNGEVYPAWMTITAVHNTQKELTNFVFTLSDITLKKAAEEQIKNLAFYDPLTKLPNRRLMLDRLEHALSSCGRQKRLGAVLMIDLDNFKTLNDSYGHNIGDKLLRSVATRLESCMRKGDTVSRMGGDEFVVIIEGLDETILLEKQVETVAKKIITHLSEPYLLTHESNSNKPKAIQYQCSCSIGIALFSEQAVTVDELIKQADTAMYSAKAAGRNTLRFFDPKMQTLISARAALEHDLYDAIKKAQFALYYQPIVSGKKKLIGVEALVRWVHPERGIIMPEQFIPAAEASGLIVPLGLWILQTACDQLTKWALVPEMAGLSMAVNVSAMQFNQPQFVSQLLDQLKRSGANPLRLSLELTESALIYDLHDVIEKMTTLKNSGISFSLDDFGTGYSSLSYLKQLPLDQLKIDQSFIKDIFTDSNDVAIAQMIIALSKSMGLGVIAEGVENHAQLNYLEHLGCHTHQGYLFSRPLPLKKFEAFAQQYESRLLKES
jgi:diguanylate cyclase (GGDEF)-like protein/PAS domain S-box-containing protein